MSIWSTLEHIRKAHFKRCFWTSIWEFHCAQVPANLVPVRVPKKNNEERESIEDSVVRRLRGKFGGSVVGFRFGLAWPPELSARAANDILRTHARLILSLMCLASIDFKSSTAAHPSPPFSDGAFRLVRCSHWQCGLLCLLHLRGAVVFCLPLRHGVSLISVSRRRGVLVWVVFLWYFLPWYLGPRSLGQHGRLAALLGLGHGPYPGFAIICKSRQQVWEAWCIQHS